MPAAHGFEGMPEVDGCSWSSSANFVLRLLRIARHPASSMTARAALLLAVAMAILSTQTVSAQCGPDQSKPYPPGQTTCPSGPAGGGPAGGGTGAGGGGSSAYISGVVPQAAGLRGEIGTVDKPVDSSKTLIYGPFEVSHRVRDARVQRWAVAVMSLCRPAGFQAEHAPEAQCADTHPQAGFSATQTTQFFDCNPGITVPGGIDTLTAEQMVIKTCNVPDKSLLDACGGHATPYHYHERMTCLYSSDPASGHSTRIGTMKDGKGLYGKYESTGALPTDLDACGGHMGVTPDSSGNKVYHYMAQDKPPFTLGCYGPVSSLDECRKLYATCGDGDTMTVTTAEGSRDYDPDCPCFAASNGPGGVTNVGGASGATAGGSTSGSSSGLMPVTHAFLISFPVFLSLISVVV